MAATAIDYPVRTPTLYWFVVGAMVAIGLVGVGLLVLSLRHGLSIGLALICGAIALVPAFYLRVTREYRARGVIRLAPGTIVVPDARGEPLTFAADRVRVRITPVVVRFTLFGIGVGDLSRGKVIELEAAGTRRRISTLTLVDTDHAGDLIDDLERVLRGEAPQGPRAPTHGRPPAPADHYEDQLERELRALD